MVEHFTLRSYARAALHCHVEVRLGATWPPFRMSVRDGAGRRKSPPLTGHDGLAWAVPGRGSVRLVCTPEPAAVDAAAGSLRWDFAVEPGQVTGWSVEVELQDQAAPPMFVAPRPSVSKGFPALDLEANDQRLGRLVGLSLADLDRLQMVTPADLQDVFLAAGAPWYLTLFGRDSIWAARLLLPYRRRPCSRALCARWPAVRVKTFDRLHRRGAGENPARGPTRLTGRPTS